MYNLAPNEMRVPHDLLEDEFLKLTDNEGIADIEGARVDVVSEGELIEPGTPVEVIDADHRAREKSPRWRANYDLIYAQCISYQARLQDYGWYIAEFIQNPKAAVPGTTMGFAGIPRGTERADLLRGLAAGKGGLVLVMRRGVSILSCMNCSHELPVTFGTTSPAARKQLLQYP